MKQLYFFLLISLWSAGESTFAQTYCPASFPGGVSAITEVRFGYMTNVSAASSTSDYEDFTGIADTVLSGINITLLVNGTTAGNFTDSVTAYFDYNQDGDFTDPGESISIGAITNATALSIGSALIKDIVIPTTTVGTLRMRIIKKRLGGSVPCNNSGIGQAEDYKLFVLAAAPPCSGTPFAGMATASVSSVCGGESFAIQLSYYTQNSGITIQWESSPMATPGYWSLVLGATSSILIVPAISQSMTYRADLTCNNGGVDISNIVTVTTPATYISPTSPFICIGDTINVTATPCSTCALTITGPNSFTDTQSFTIYNASLANKGWYYTSTTDNSCNTVNTDSFYVNVVNCADSVWPGDANNDLITNYLDALYVALYNGASGYSRPNASINYTSQFCLDWAVTASTISI
ncbi:MAG TPA: GEVED domain-containing protein [Flavipsychrobacter sp.]|nr:GEVED domain-containing protein [Flavipsychrobacter sp.]